VEISKDDEYLVDSPHCNCGEGKGTMEHYLLEFIRYVTERTKVGADKMKTALLFRPKLIKTHGRGLHRDRIITFDMFR